MSIVDSLRDIHREVWSKFEYVTDRENYNSDEYWIIPDDFLNGNKFTGDCEDFAMCCRVLCRQRNIPSQLVVCVDETGEYHCVLHVEGFILDNRHRSVKTVDELGALGYKWVAISGYTPGDLWHRVLL